MSFYVGLAPFVIVCVTVIVWHFQAARRTPEQCLSRMRMLSRTASKAIKDFGAEVPTEQPPMLTWRDVAVIYTNSRTVMLPMARKLAEVSPTDAEIVHTRRALLRQHRRLRGLLLVHVFESVVDRINSSIGSPTTLRAYTKPVIWAYSEEILMLENLLEAVSAPASLTNVLEEIL